MMEHCPSDYALQFSWEESPSCETLYVVGGLYGNFQALQALKSLVEPEALVVFNGDIHWFDASVESFVRIEEGIADYILLNGNVEVELARQEKSEAGCGCFYPSWTSSLTVKWANAIHERLRERVDSSLRGYKERLGARAKNIGLWVGGKKVAVTHGDEKSLAGWMCSKENLQNPKRQRELEDWLKENEVSILASSHTCGAALLALPHGVVINNGAAGLPNFPSLGSGVITRISTQKAPFPRLYGTYFEGLFIDAIELNYDSEAFIKEFRAIWGEDSPAFLSYGERIERGNPATPKEALVVSYSDSTPFGERISDSLKETQKLHTMQLNLGKVCNLACRHCHVEAGPNRREQMSQEVMKKALELFVRHGFETLDITGGAPEMNPHFEWLIHEGSKVASRLIVRTNLVILKESPWEHLAEFYAQHKVELVASLPEVSEEEVDRVRGRGVYGDSIEVIKRLNALGYGKNPDLKLDFVYNPSGPFLPPRVMELERLYKEQLFEKEEIFFHRLLSMNNIPIGRFRDSLERSGELLEYETLLRTHFNPSATPHLMCRSQISVSYEGRIYDCDFNQMLSLEAQGAKSLEEMLIQKSLKRRVVFGEHCYACTAGLGSSCQGVIAPEPL